MAAHTGRHGPGGAIGRPRVYKGHALLFGCDETGVRDRRLTKRAFPDGFRNLKKGGLDPLQVWECDGDEIVKCFRPR